MNSSNIYIVIVTYNGMKWIPKTFASIPKETYVIVVDNHSNDGTVAYIRQHFPSFIILEQASNLGFGQGNNLGIHHALKMKADYIFLLNQDAYLQENCLNNLVSVAKKNPLYGILSPIHLNGAGDALDVFFATYLRRNPRFIYDEHRAVFEGVYEVPFVNAAAWLLSTKTIAEVGGFDPIFFHYGEDDNYCQRVRHHGYKIGVVAQSLVMHDRFPEKRKDDAPFSRSYFSRRERSLKIRFGDINKYFPPGYYEASSIWRLGVNLLKAFIYRLHDEKKSSPFWRAPTQTIKAELALLRRCKGEIRTSRETNINKGPNYLNQHQARG